MNYDPTLYYCLKSDASVLLRKIKPRQAFTVLLRDFYGLTWEEIGKKILVDSTTAQSIYQGAIWKLRWYCRCYHGKSTLI